MLCLSSKLDSDLTFFYVPNIANSDITKSESWNRIVPTKSCALNDAKYTPNLHFIDQLLNTALQGRIQDFGKGGGVPGNC